MEVVEEAFDKPVFRLQTWRNVIAKEL